jgi:ATP-dependent Clp protease ATP-binding subunit ClpC
MIRLDMSEFKSPETVRRLVGGEGSRGTPLVDQIRNQPFSIVLLDEFEKAHPNVWDYFLQLFDDGRLTDWQGRPADFRHCLIIMTSNIGASIQSFGKTGFVSGAGQLLTSTVMAALEREFRKEFLNRIDRVVVFRPLTRETMRAILRKELRDAYERRGLRTRPWAIEWDDSAIELLLERGFTMDLGARPLKRAIEQYVLAPIARTIVNRVVPHGDQFLFVRAAENEIAVDFVDPDRQTVAPPPPAAVADNLSMESLAIEPRGIEDEVRCLEQELAALEKVIRGPEWQRSKTVGMSMMSLPEFWSSPERFSILNQVEYRDRAEVGFETAESLLRRLQSADRRNDSYPRDLIARLAHQLFLLGAAVEAMEKSIPWEAFLSIDAPDVVSGSFAQSLFDMYRNWSNERGMRLTDLTDPSSPRRMLLAVSGFGAYSLLAAEDGLHVMEIPRQHSVFDRVTVRVRVVPQPVEPLAPGETVRQAALRILEKNPPGATVVRRYREEPSPLVRDSVRNWRTGRLDLVLAGNFDLISRGS